MKHTPGSWEARSPYKKPFSIWGADGKLITSVIHGDDLTQRIANANLIAAAPDMLKALQYIVKVLGPLCMAQDTPEGIAYYEAEKAINRANGNR